MSAQDEGSDERPLDPAQQLYLQQTLMSEQNMVLGALAGAAAALLGAGLWAAVTLFSGYQIGFMAIGVGYLVGFAVRAAGKGMTPAFGIVGAACALLGCAVGNLLTVLAMVAEHEGIPFLSAIEQLDLALAKQLMVATFDPMDLVFYGIAIYEGYRLSFRRISAEELEARLSGGA